MKKEEMDEKLAAQNEELIALNKELDENNKLLKRDYDVIKSCAKEYISLYYIDLETEAYEVCNLGETVTEGTKAIVAKKGKIFMALQEWIKYVAADESLGKMLSLVTREGVLKALAGRTIYTTRFKNKNNGAVLWEEIVFIKNCAPEEVPKNIVLGFRDVTEDVKLSIARQQELQGLFEKEQAQREELQALNEQSTAQNEELIALNQELDEHNKELGVFERLNRANIWRLTFDDKGQIDKVYWSDNMRQAFGVDDVEGAPISMEIGASHIHPDDYDRVMERFYAAVNDKTGATVFETEYRVQLKSGDWNWFRTASEIYRYPDGRPQYAIGTVTDIEAQKRNEEQRSIIDVLSDDFFTVYTWDLATNETSVVKIANSSEAWISGRYDKSRPVREYLEPYLREVVYQDDQERLRAALNREQLRENLAHKKNLRVTFRRRYGDDYKYVDCVIGKEEAADEPARKIVVGFQMVDDRVKAAKAAEQKTQQALTVANYFVDSFVSAYYIELSTHNQYVYTRTAHLHENYDGIDDYLVSVTKYIDKDVHPDDRETMHRVVQPEYIKEALKEKKSFSLFFRDVSEGQEKNYRYLVIRGADEDHIAMMFSDVTEEVKIEKENQARLENALDMAQSANRAKSTFLNSMSHDIRTPMNSIIGYTSLATEHLDDREQMQQFLGRIMSSSKHLLSLINDVLDMARIESGKMNLTETKESLPEILHTLRDIVLSDVHAKQLDFFIDTVNIRNEIIVCDKTRLNQVLLNILGNAIKYTPSGGTVSLRIAETAVSHAGYGTYEFHIKDSGVGMSSEEVASIYEPFARAASADANQIVGTGLGMSIVKNIVDMMGGRISVKSEEGKGTEVIITLDFKLEDISEENDAVPELKGVRGIVVDDDMSACKSISQIMKSIGMRSDWCTNGREAVFRAEEAAQEGEAYRVCFIDWMMPNMNGIDLTRRVRKIAGDDVPIVIMTAYDYSDIESEAKEAGVTAFISKPLFRSDLVKKLRELCVKKEKTGQLAPAYDFCGMKLLLVEDNEDNRDIAERMLKQSGISVTSVINGKIAVETMELAKPGDFDVILMDIRMPVMDGLEATRLIRGLNNGMQDIPIIALTANAFDEDREAALEAGMNEHVAKPIDVSELTTALAKYKSERQ